MLGLTKVITGVCAAALLAGGAVAGCGASRHSMTLSRVSCGSAATRFIDGTIELVPANPGALSCFDSAVRNCSAASIAVTAMGVDAGTRYVFAVQPGADRCQVTEQSQFYMVSGGFHHGPVTTVTCQRAAAAASGVTLSCGGRDIVISARLSVTGGEAAS